MSTRVLPAGDRAVLVEVADNQQARALATAVRAQLAETAEDVVVGHRTVLVVWAGPQRSPVVDWDALLADGDAASQALARPAVVLPVAYDGPDLAAVAAHARCSVEEVVRRHRRPRYTVGFVGFSPGFAYLIGGDPALVVPRRAEPRARVPAGSVALGGPYTAAYPSESPGGWQIIGHTPERLFDPERATPALLPAGADVRIRDLTGQP